MTELEALQVRIEDTLDRGHEPTQSGVLRVVLDLVRALIRAEQKSEVTATKSLNESEGRAK